MRQYREEMQSDNLRKAFFTKIGVYYETKFTKYINNYMLQKTR